MTFEYRDTFGHKLTTIRETDLDGQPVVTFWAHGKSARVPVRVELGRLEEVLAGARDTGRQGVMLPSRSVRTLTPSEHDRAWHAIEGAKDPDPGTVLAAVLRALRINAPTVEDEQADSPRLRDAARQAAGQPTPHRIPCGQCGAPWSDGHGQPGDPCSVDQLPVRRAQLATPCAYCGHTYNWHTLSSGCQVTAGDAGCGCSTFIAPVVEQPAEAQPAEAQTARARLAALIGYEPSEHDAEYEKRVDELIAASLHEAARRMEGAGYDDDAVNFLDLLADRQTVEETR